MLHLRGNIVIGWERGDDCSARYDSAKGVNDKAGVDEGEGECHFVEGNSRVDSDEIGGGVNSRSTPVILTR